MQQKTLHSVCGNASLLSEADAQIHAQHFLSVHLQHTLTVTHPTLSDVPLEMMTQAVA